MITFNRGMNARSLVRTCALFAALAGGAVSANAQDAGLPGGAQSLSETYKDWTIACRLVEQQVPPADAKQDRASASSGPSMRICSVSQQQVTENRQTVLTVELRPDGDGMTGGMILPFGLALAKGILLKVDAADISQPIPFSTCLPTGCLVLFRFDTAIVAALRQGNMLSVLVSDRNGQPLELGVSLSGFAAATDRLQILTN